MVYLKQDGVEVLPMALTKATGWRRQYSTCPSSHYSVFEVIVRVKAEKKPAKDMLLLEAQISVIVRKL